MGGISRTITFEIVWGGEAMNSLFLRVEPTVRCRRFAAGYVPGIVNTALRLQKISPYRCQVLLGEGQYISILV